MNDKIELFETYKTLALAEGALDAVLVRPDDIVFDGRTLFKCMFGCADWGKGPTCPSRHSALKPWEWEPLLRKYSAVLVIRSHDKRIAQKAAYTVEMEAFFNGDALAFSMSDCAVCATCAGAGGGACRFPEQARPAFHSVGIDVFSTAKKLGLPLMALRDHDEEHNWYSAVWLNEVIDYAIPRRS